MTMHDIPMTIFNGNFSQPLPTKNHKIVSFHNHKDRIKMALSKISLAIVSFVALTMARLSQAQSSPQDFLAAHNAARAQIRVKPLTWNNTVAAYAENYAKLRSADCNLEHSNGPYGENIAESSGELTAVHAVKLWVDEKPKYSYGLNACIGEAAGCLHYTQVVWRNTAQIGCARVQCQNKWWFVTCNYYPPGNYVGQRPY
ncbi:pathogenesis-related leaf protein 6-like [Camellia sinensis]|nr:pathogenesis-related leaf protein 6-like [Camellia sinensis]XP_028061665.1 pathogenesis-related leaf protein 6-like [Camellia sinensis]XP_028068725.1 pathogenesis-related leaf protein 6-like [Camellia sinensis]XP_028077947.1 pathogenesis-related leaf protein 6-like [Camellia sinensis]